MSLESWQVLRDGNLLLEWALNLIVLTDFSSAYMFIVWFYPGFGLYWMPKPDLKGVGSCRLMTFTGNT